MNEWVYYEADEEKTDKLLDVLNRMFVGTEAFDTISLSNFTPDHDNKKLIGYVYGKNLID